MEIALLEVLDQGAKKNSLDTYRIEALLMTSEVCAACSKIYRTVGIKIMTLDMDQHASFGKEG